jgi:hypothetical protein
MIPVALRASVLAARDDGRVRWKLRLKLVRRSRGRPVSALPQPRGLGEPPAGDADDAELDALRAELVRELDRRAADRGRGS